MARSEMPASRGAYSGGQRRPHTSYGRSSGPGVLCHNWDAYVRPETIPSVATIDPTEMAATPHDRTAVITRRIVAQSVPELPRSWRISAWSCFMPVRIVAAFWICSEVRTSRTSSAAARRSRISSSRA